MSGRAAGRRWWDHRNLAPMRLPHRARFSFVALTALVAALAALTAAPEARQDPRSPWLAAAVRQAAAGERVAAWVYFTDKAGAAGTAPVSSRARQRRARRGTALAAADGDRNLSRAYVTRVASMVDRVRHESRWLNAVSVDATPAQIQALAALPFVARLDVVRRYRRVPERIESLPDGRRSGPGTAAAAGEPLDYGTAADQVRQIRVPELHERGLHGEGVVVAVFDGGFPNLEHEAFAGMTILAERDFVRGLDTVRESTDEHGTNTLSTLGGYAPGQLIGPAFRASFLLAVTEDGGSETPIEEDHWAAAAEWAEAQGADVISSSLGYVEFDSPYTSYTDADMNGQTAVTTRAAAWAAERGVVVVNSAGNEGLDASDNTLVAPGDGVRVLTVGAVTRVGARTSFSSVGPTSDGRIKPDVMAMGQGVKVARDVGNGYGLAAGTSFSCPLTAGVVALVLQAHPEYAVDQVLDVLRTTASRADAPDRLFGWGIVNAVAAVDAPPPSRPSEP